MNFVANNRDTILVGKFGQALKFDSAVNATNRILRVAHEIKLRSVGKGVFDCLEV